MIYFSDLHLRPESEDVCFRVLEEVWALSRGLRDRHVACLGDFFHTRYAVPVYLLNRVWRMFRQWTQDDGIKLYLLPGNHDQIDLAGQSAMEVFGDLPGVQVFTEPTWDPGTGTWLPYRKDPAVLLGWLRETPEAMSAPVIHMHHGIAGAWMNSGQQATMQDGVRPEDLPVGARVYCGHWHRHQVVQQCVYAGSPWQTRADEAGQRKGVLWTDPQQNGGNITGPLWRFLPLAAGPSFHRFTAFSREEVAAVRPGDVVRIGPEMAERDVAGLVKALQELGAEVQVERAPRSTAAPRLAADMPLRQQAERYAAAVERPDGLALPDLMALWDEVAG